MFFRERAGRNKALHVPGFDRNQAGAAIAGAATSFDIDAIGFRKIQ